MTAVPGLDVRRLQGQAPMSFAQRAAVTMIVVERHTGLVHTIRRRYSTTAGYHF
jgi:hypothetical protein